jgi:hypothetical protein
MSQPETPGEQGSAPPAGKPRRQFRLITLFAVMLLACVPLAWMAVEARRQRARTAAEARVQELGGRIHVTLSILSPGSLHNYQRSRIVLDHTSVGDDDLKLLAEISDLESLDVTNTEVSDAGIEHLKGLRHLNTLNHSGSRITPEGIAKLRRSIPQLRTDDDRR